MRTLLCCCLAVAVARKRVRYACDHDARAGDDISGDICRAPSNKPRLMVSLGPGYELRWLHIPKCGTSFATAVYRAACPRLPPHAAIPKPTTPFPGHVQDYFASCFPKDASRGACHLAPEDTFAPSPTHVPLRGFDPTRYAYATMLRDPWQRLASAHRWKAQFFDAGCVELTAACAHRNLGIYVNMINGNWSDGRTTRTRRAVAYPDDAAVAAAVARLADFAFVGIVERWDESLCLFHATFGGFLTSGELVERRRPAATFREIGETCAVGQRAPRRTSARGGDVRGDVRGLGAAAGLRPRPRGCTRRPRGPPALRGGAGPLPAPPRGRVRHVRLSPPGRGHRRALLPDELVFSERAPELAGRRRAVAVVEVAHGDFHGGEFS